MAANKQTPCNSKVEEQTLHCIQPPLFRWSKLTVLTVQPPPRPSVPNFTQASPQAPQAPSPLSRVWQAAQRAELSALVDLGPQVWSPPVDSRHPPRGYGRRLRQVGWGGEDWPIFRFLLGTFWRRFFLEFCDLG